MPFIAADSDELPEVSVIIPLHEDGSRFRTCLAACAAMQVETKFEVVVVSDQPTRDLPAAVVHGTTGSHVATSPATKRDVGETLARGQVLAFLDDDAYPSTNWLDAAMHALRHSDAHGVGGPGLTPPFSSRRERLSGAIYESRLGSGPLRFRFLPVGAPRNCDDLPAYNLVIRRESIAAVGGWASSYYGGEDTKLCLELTAAGFRLRYDPGVVVYHHRRPMFRAHLKQVANVGRHRGFFARIHPQTSRRPIYFMPLLGVLALGPLTYVLLHGLVAFPRATVGGLAGAWLALSASAGRELGLSATLYPGALCLHHAAYGVGFVRGLTSAELDDFAETPRSADGHGPTDVRQTATSSSGRSSDERMLWG